MASENMAGQARIEIAAPPEKLYGMVSDVTRYGEWSPENTTGQWLDGATGPTAGARFKGKNKRGIARWSTTCTVEVADPGREFTFVVKNGDKEKTRWSYRLEPSGDGTVVTESFQSIDYGFPETLLASRKRRGPQMQAGIEETLRHLKEAAESA